MKTHTILIVDDQGVNRKILRRLLESDYEILEAENGREALAVLKANSKDIAAVVLDIVMPVMDGYAVLSAMQEDAALSKIPVIVSSQKDGDEAEVKALTLGAQDFIAKPYKGDIIRHRLENTIRLRETAAIANRAEKDELTGLLNKAFFCEQVAVLLRANPEKQYDMLCFDVERFKLVNDTYGEKTGDALLCHIAGLLAQSPIGLLNARFNADHFYQLIERPQQDLSPLVRESLEKVRAFPIELNLNVNCGVYPIEKPHTRVSGMCDRAKLAAELNRTRSADLYTFYDDSIRKKLIEEQFIIGSMKQGLEEHQFQVYYQPKYDLHTEMVAGAEALVRWVHPERGFLSPGAFIPIFERNGFITRLDRYVWEQACADIRRWMDEGLPPVPVSVNVSRADIFNPNLPEILTGLVEKYRIPMACLHLEVTESAYTDNPHQIIEVVGKLHDLGFVIEMDDFGSGYSSLNMLAELPVDVLKLDMGFVQSETTSTSGRGIMSFVISLAKWMKLSVIAEGVETVEQIEALRSMDCNFVQGFYFAKPMPRAAFENTLRTVSVSTLQQAAEHGAAQAAPAPDQSRCTMLVVDDIEVNRAVLSSIFSNEYNVVEQNDGRAAMEYLRKHGHEVEIVLLDLLMPVMDGFQLLKLIKADETLSQIPVVVTSQGDISAEEKALDMGADDFISKPYSPAIVNHRVHNVVQMHRVQAAQRQELTDTLKRERTLLNSIPGGVALYHLKKDGRLATEYVSEGLAVLMGYTPDDFLNLIRDDARVVVDGADLPRLNEALRPGVSGHVLLHGLLHLHKKEGGIISVNVDARVLAADGSDPDETAVLYAAHTHLSDKTENAMREQSRYRYILENLDVACFELDTEGRFYASDKYSLYTISDESLVDVLLNGTPCKGIHPDDMPALFDFARQLHNHMSKITMTARLKMRDGSYRWTEILGFFEYGADGVYEKATGVFRDVDNEWRSQNHKLQEALAEAERADRAKTEFLERVSHEMRTPLNGILGLTELLRTPADPETRRGQLEQLKQSGRYLLDLIDDTLDVGSIERGELQLNPVVCDGKSLLRNVVGLAKPKMDAKHIHFTMQAANLPYTSLYLDVGRVEQAMMNILSNAVKFTPDGGTITLTIENLSQKDGVITDRIVVRDTGIGMSREFLAKLFEPFAQEHADTRTIYHGTGLGMTIAKQCIELMGGTIAVESEPDKGTTVTIVLPMHEATPEQRVAWFSTATDLSLLKGKRVLLCEDHPLNAQIAVRLLESKGMLVEHAENGKVGVELFAASEPDYYDVVLMDIRMPVMDGLEATRKIRALSRRDARRVPIIAMTANALREDVKASLNAGMTEHLGKPVEPAKLYHMLATLIDNPNPYADSKVLVVDDIDVNRAFVRKAIGETYTVLEAANGEQALELLRKEPDIAAVVTDVQMPVMDGKELIRRIHADSKLDHVAILANTVYGDHRQEDELLALGANDFIYKPTSPQVILMRLEHILRNRG